ncbi:hypothetical protein WH47_10167 [Habropoda laboriosa]|uniref:Uncharacterized protein n=1 Tax=Habropoda laboriosa TaxID=597456 RepID=A0A0L7R494_9HYME|nr:hypothetical protein WH47_10167 [Habropoda laboriosa]
MSFFPLEEVKCGPLKPRKYPATVVGTPNATWGYRLLEKSNCKLFKVPESFESLDEEKRREYEHLTKILEFEGLTNRRIKKKKVWQRVQQELAAYSKEERKNRMLSYRKDLEDQWKQAEDVRRREAEREEERRLEEKRREEEYEKLTEELLHASEDITPHPFKILLRECAARYAAEKEGLCYCPPPLSGDSN